MQEENKKEWIVLINRAPKGPLVQEEIQALIDEGIIRRNDLACLVHSDKSQKSDWKFLWQFAEFNRRGDVPFQNTPPKVEERREQIAPEQLQLKAKALLPEEIESIRTEDLLIHSTSISSRAFDGDPELTEEDIQLPTVSSSNTHPFRVFASLSVVIIALFFLARSFKKPENKAAVVPGASTLKLPLNNPLENERPVAAVQTRAPSASLPQITPRKVEPPKPPEARDQGDIAYEEYRRKRDAEIERERQKEEEERNAELKQEEEERSDEDRPKKKKGSVKEEEEEAPTDSDKESDPPSDDPGEDRSAED